MHHETHSILIAAGLSTPKADRVVNLLYTLEVYEREMRKIERINKTLSKLYEEHNETAAKVANLKETLNKEAL